RRHSRLRGVAADRLDRAKRLALDVSDRGIAGAGDLVDPPEYSGVAALGGGERAAAAGVRAAAERRRARRRRCGTDKIYRGRPVLRQIGAAAADLRLSDDAVGDL